MSIKPELSCIICLDSIGNDKTIVFANCNHGKHTHKKCMNDWNDTCPLCRKNINLNKTILSRVDIINMLTLRHDYYKNVREPNLYNTPIRKMYRYGR